MKFIAVFFCIIGSALIFSGCLPMITSQERDQENKGIDQRLADGEITAEEARWRRKVIDKMATTYRFDMGSVESLVGFGVLLLGGSTGTSILAQRLLRGPAKPMDKESAVVLMDMVKERKNGGTHMPFTT